MSRGRAQGEDTVDDKACGIDDQDWGNKGQRPYEAPDGGAHD